MDDKLTISSWMHEVQRSIHALKDIETITADLRTDKSSPWAEFREAFFGPIQPSLTARELLELDDE